VLCLPIIGNYFLGLVLLSDWVLNCNFLLFFCGDLILIVFFGSNLGFLFLFLCVCGNVCRLSNERQAWMVGKMDRGKRGGDEYRVAKLIVLL